ncbi:MAG TPA: hypothetical protein PK191_07680 [Niabella sp.]|nr:hypothetical protein [Niabella sp.]HOZ97636.1 hypothetical protein [Niabella sp.]HQW15774.1 hypothetical protein [Niabella sp.]HQX21049.1 hypothetical protein [Niabella sp.]HQX42358.1 hypothetical protein [Niabella sp.]
MKKLTYFLIAVFIFTTNASKAALITVNSGDVLNVSGWAADDYIVYGTLNSGSTLEMGGSLTIKSGGKVNVTTTFSAYGPSIIVESGGELNAASLAVQGSPSKPFMVAGKVQLTGSATFNGYFHLLAGGIFNAINVDFSNPNNTVEGIITSSGTVTFHNAPNTMTCPGQIITQHFTNSSGPNPISGSGYIQVNGNFDSNNSLTLSSTIYLNVIGGIPMGENKGSATVGLKSEACNGTLPVIFGQIQSIIENNILKVQWSTLSETNNDHFNIEVSADGSKFFTADKISSKALGGNSENTILYTRSLSISGPISQALGGSLAIAFLGIGLFSIRKKKSLFNSLFIVAISSLAFFACSKNDTSFDHAIPSKVFVRIVQVDKDGNSRTSEIVKAIIK